MHTIFGAVAELEREYIKLRQREGIEIAKGKYKGRPAKQLNDFEEVYQQWEFRFVNDMLDIIDIKIYNLVGTLEIFSLGIGALHNTEDSYEISSVNISFSIKTSSILSL